MSYFEDYVADGLCCNVCGAYIDGEEPGYPRTCNDCLEYEKQEKKKQKQKATGKKIIQKTEKELQNNKINYVLKNEETGHFHTRRKFDNQLIEFYAYTGKIAIVGKIQNERGIKALIKILLGKESICQNSKTQEE
jgi:predicted nucleic acid-binding Zn ribbon protein